MGFIYIYVYLIGTHNKANSFTTIGFIN